MENKIKISYDNISPSDRQKDRILSNVLNSSKSVDSNNTKVIRKEFFMKRKSIVVAIALICILAISGTVYATYKWLSADQATQKMGHDKLSKALSEKYGKSEDQIQIMRGDKITAHYLGLVSGKKLANDFEVDTEQSYIITAISKNDGSKMTYEDKDIIVTPFIKGIDPKDFNIYTIGGGKESQIVDGVLYSITECASLEIFADKGAYIGIMEGPDFFTAYNYDKKTGEITRNKNFKGLNLLFEVKLDSSKADSKAAKKFLDNLKNNEDANDESQESSPKEKSIGSKKVFTEDDLESAGCIKNFMEITDDEELDSYIKKSSFINNSKKELKSDKKGNIICKYGEDWISFPDDVRMNQTFYYINSTSDNTDILIHIEYTNGKYFESLYKSPKSVRDVILAKEQSKREILSDEQK